MSKQDSGRVFLTSDTHFFHENVIKYCDRPFPTVEIMNRAIIDRWNSVVGPEDTVYHLGDVFMGPREPIPALIAQLHGTKILIRGNHDRSVSAMLSMGFDNVYRELFLETDAGIAYLHHQPMPEQHWKGQADFHLCGHVHIEWVRQGNVINVGVDVWDFTPRTIQELLGA